MKSRGQIFWDWGDNSLHTRVHDEVLKDGTEISIQTRLSRTGGTELFIGVYALDGNILLEEAHNALPEKTMTTALSWGIQRARQVAQGEVPLRRSGDRAG